MREKDYYGAIKGFCLKWNLPEVWNSDRITGANLIYEVIKVMNDMIKELRDYEDRVDGKLEEMKNMIDDFLKMFDEDLSETVRLVLVEWKDSGILDGIINDALFNQKLDKSEFDVFKNDYDLSNFGKPINLNSFEKLESEIDDSGRFQRAIDYAGNLGLTLFIPKGNYFVSETININYEAFKMVGEKGGRSGVYEYGTVINVSSVNRSFVIDNGGIKDTQTFGATKTNIVIKNISFLANIDQQNDEFDYPRFWQPTTCLYLNGSRQMCIIEGCRFSGFETAIYSLYNWFINIKNNWFIRNKNGLIMNGENNNCTISDNIFAYIGSREDRKGYALNIIESYGLNVLNNDFESNAGYGIVYENCHGVNHIGGDIENNLRNERMIVVKNYKNESPEKWSYGVNIFGVRFRNSLGIWLDFTRNINIMGCTFETNIESVKKNNNTIYATSNNENVNIGANDYFLDNNAYKYVVPRSCEYRPLQTGGNNNSRPSNPNKWELYYSTTLLSLLVWNGENWLNTKNGEVVE